MRLKEWLYFLTDDIGNSYAISNNNVIAVPTPSPLGNTPDGWRDQMINVKKSTTYFGTTREFTIPLRFVRTGARILRTIVYTQGFEKNVYLIILKLDPHDQVHKNWYKGEIDFSQMTDELDFFDITVAEGGLPKYLKANEAITYEIPLNSDSETLELDGIALKQSTTSLITGWTEQTGFDIMGAHLPESSILGNEGEDIPTSVNATSYVNLKDKDNTDNPSIYATGNSFFKGTTSSDITFSCDFRFKSAYYQTPVGGGTQPLPPWEPMEIRVDLRVFRGGVINQTINIYHSNDIGLYYNAPLLTKNLVLHEVKGDFTMHVEPDDQVFLYLYATPWRTSPGSIFGGGEFVTFWYNDADDLNFQPGTVSVRFYFRYKPTKARALRSDKLFKQLVEKLSEGHNTGAADYLSPTGAGTSGNPFRTILITSGDAIRQLDNSVIKTSFKDYFKSMNTPKNIGIGYQGDKMILDKKRAFFTGDIVYNLGFPKSRPKVTLAEDYVFSSMKIGYPDSDYDDINGRSEFNNTFEWNLPVKRVVKELDLQSIYRADGYGIEFTRINLVGKTTTDNKSDNDVFMIDAAGVINENGQIVWTPFRPIFYSTTGLLSAGSVINLGITPKRCLNNHDDFLHSFLFKLDDQKITYQTTEKNSAVSTTDILGRTVSEKADVFVSSLNQGYFQPFYLEVTIQVPINMIELIAMSRAGRFQFEWDGVPYRGVLIDGGIKPVTKEEVTLKLLASSDCDLTKLIA